MKETVDGWIETVDKAKEKFGFPAIVVGVFLLLYTGWLPSPLTSAHERMEGKIWEIQVMVSTLFSFKHAECLNKAEADSQSNEKLFAQGALRCNEANAQLERYLRSLGTPRLAQGE